MLRRTRPHEKETVVTREVVVQNELGLHARPAAEFCRLANRFRAEITLIKNNERYSAESLIEILRANLDCGARATLEARGVDAEKAVARLENLLEEFRHRKEE